jgi:acetyl-CoA C-acetyltransferase
MFHRLIKMSIVFVFKSLRTPFGSFGGTLLDIDVPHPGATVIKGLVDRAGLDSVSVDVVIFGKLRVKMVNAGHL